MRWMDDLSTFQLRLDSRLFLYKDDSEGILLYEAYSIFRGPIITRIYGSFNRTHGLFIEQPEMWMRRSDLAGLKLTNGLLHWTAFNVFETADNGTELLNVRGPMNSILQHLAMKLNFTVTNVYPKDGKWGSLNGESWDGLVRDVMTDYIDISSAGLTMTEERSEAVDFSHTITTSYATLVARMRQGKETQFRVYVDIFPASVWIFLAALCLTLGTALAAIEETRLHPLQGLIFVARQTLQLGSDLTLRTKSGRILFMITSMFAYITFAYYTCDLTARMTLGPPENMIRSMADIIPLGYQVNVSTCVVFKIKFFISLGCCI